MFPAGAGYCAGLGVGLLDLVREVRGDTGGDAPVLLGYCSGFAVVLHRGAIAHCGCVCVQGSASRIRGRLRGAESTNTAFGSVQAGPAARASVFGRLVARARPCLPGQRRRSFVWPFPV